MFFEIARIIKDKQPKIVFLENVKGLLNHDQGKTFATILNTLGELGYSTEWVVLNSRFFGVPQFRERLYIIGHIGKIKYKILPTGRKRKSEYSYIKHINIPDEVRYLSKERKNIILKNMKYTNTIDTGGYIRRLGGWNGKSLAQRTLKRLTPIECERLQGFSDNWTEGVPEMQRYKQIGNAVTINVIIEIGKILRRGI